VFGRRRREHRDERDALAVTLGPTDLSALGLSVDLDRLAALTLRLVGVRSYPGEEAAIASEYAGMLAEAGADVRIETSVSGSPSVVARIGPTDSRCLQLSGHLDTVPLAHELPYISGDLLYGRGACDMKAGLAAIVETTRLLAPILDDLGGQILVTAYGLHEGAGAAPMHTPLRNLLAAGHKGDTAIVCEGPLGMLPVAGKGSLVFRVEIARPTGLPDHELRARDTPNPILAAQAWITLADRVVSESKVVDPVLGGETLFIGSIHGGALYNTVPEHVTLEGTRRYPPPRSFDDVAASLDEIGLAVEEEFGVRITSRYERSGQPFELSHDEPILSCLRHAHETVTGAPLPLGHQLFSSDLNHFVCDGGIPTAAYGVDPERGHATPEFVSLSELLSVTRVLVLTAASFLATSNPGDQGWAPPVVPDR
jgi:acetylornithine deacetylase/succinyl-diaminopimelate desuccinylase-like protein